MLLIVSNTTDVTADFLRDILKGGGYPTLRLNTDVFPLEPALTLKWGKENGLEGLLVENNSEVRLEDIKTIWWRRPQDHGKSACDLIKDPQAKIYAEKQIKDSLEIVQSILYSRQDVLWVNHPNNNFRANAKLLQLEAASSLGFDVPDTILSNEPKKLREFVQLYGEVVFKANRRTAFFVDDDLVGFYTTQLDLSALANDSSIRVTPVFLQRMVKKWFELRVTVIGNRVFAARINSQNFPEGILDWRKIPDEPGLWEAFSLDQATENRCKALLERFGLHFGAIDLAITPEGRNVFFEINPNGQWAWLEIEAGLPMSEAFVELFFETLHKH